MIEIVIIIRQIGEVSRSQIYNWFLSAFCSILGWFFAESEYYYCLIENGFDERVGFVVFGFLMFEGFSEWGGLIFLFVRWRL